RLDDALCPLRVGHAVTVGHRGAAGPGDLVHDLAGDAGVGALAVGRAAQVVHDDLAALGRRQQRDLPADAAPGTGHDHHLAREAAPLSHPGLPLAYCFVRHSRTAVGRGQSGRRPAPAGPSMTARSTCSGRKPTPTIRAGMPCKTGRYRCTKRTSPGSLGSCELRSTGSMTRFCTPIWKACVARVGKLRRCWTLLRSSSAGMPRRSGPTSRLAAAMASWMARLIPTPP